MISLKPMIRLIPVFILMSVFSCKDPVPSISVDDQDSLARFVLSSANHRLTSLDLRIQWLHFIPPVPVTVYSNDDSLTSFYQKTTDTTLTITGLTPSTDYRLTVKSRFTPPTLATIKTRTMDTTSHDFTWRLDTLGRYNSYLRDVAIVNDTCVWVVGELFPPDYPNSWIYNAAMWNGKIWTKHRIETPSYPSGYMSATPAYSIIYIDGLLWVTTNDGAYAISEDLGKTWKGMRYPLGTRKGYITKAWADSRDNIYWVGSHGSITHYDGKNFRLIESGTTIDLLDITAKNKEELWITGCVGGASPGDPRLGSSILLSIKNGVVEKVIEESDGGPKPINGIPTYLFFTTNYPPEDDGLWLATAWGLFRLNQTTDTWNWVYRRINWFFFPPMEMGAPEKIRSTGPNNIFLCGGEGSVVHYNGNTFRQYQELLDFELDWKSIDVKGSKIALAGFYNGGNAAVCIGSN